MCNLYSDKEIGIPLTKDAVILPGEVVVVKGVLAFAQSFGYSPDFELADSDPGVLDMEKFKVWSGGVINLNNAGDEILLLDPADNLLDKIPGETQLLHLIHLHLL